MAHLRGSASPAGALVGSVWAGVVVYCHSAFPKGVDHIDRFTGAHGVAKGHLGSEGLRWTDESKFEWVVNSSHGC